MMKTTVKNERDLFHPFIINCQSNLFSKLNQIQNKLSLAACFLIYNFILSTVSIFILVTTVLYSVLEHSNRAGE